MSATLPRRDDRRIAALETVPEAIDRLRHWYIAEWPAWYGPTGPGDALSDLRSCLLSDPVLPRCLVALNRSSEPVGTISLRSNSPGSERYSGVWLTALLVPDLLRRSGIGTELVAAAEAEARRLGYAEIFASTASAQSLFVRRHWAFQDKLKTDNGGLDIFRKAL